MKALKHDPLFLAIAVLVIALCVAGSGCRGSDNATGGNAPGNVAVGPGGPGAGPDNVLGPEMGPGAGVEAGPAPGVGPGVGTGPGRGAGAMAAPGSPGLQTEEPITFRQVRDGKGDPLRPKEVAVKQPDGRVVRYLRFYYYARNDAESVLPILDPRRESLLDVGSTWHVLLPKQCATGKRTPGEWENMFYTYVVPDTEAISDAIRTVEARMAAVRERLYREPVYVVDLLAGEKLPPGAWAQAGDSIASATGAPEQRALEYLRLALQAQEEHHPELARFFAAAAARSVADLIDQNGRDADALYLYRLVARELR